MGIIKGNAGSGKATGTYQKTMANDVRCSLLQYSQSNSSTQPFNVDAHVKATRRLFADAFVMLSTRPAQLHLSYFVDRNGCICCRAERDCGI